MSERVVRGPDDDPNLTDEELLAQRQAWFEAYTQTRNIFAPVESGPYTCPCCGHRTLHDRGGTRSAESAGWEDDGQDDHDSAVVRGGPNGRLGLDEARVQYVARGGVPQEHTRPTQPT